MYNFSTIISSGNFENQKVNKKEAGSVPFNKRRYLADFKRHIADAYQDHSFAPLSYLEMVAKNVSTSHLSSLVSFYPQQLFN